MPGEAPASGNTPGLDSTSLFLGTACAEPLKNEIEDFIVWNWVPQFLRGFSLIVPEVHLFRGINCSVPCTDVGVVGFPLACFSSHVHSSRMTRAETLLIIMLLVCSPLLAQGNRHATVHDGLIEEQYGHFDAAISAIKLAVDSNQLSGIELGRAYIMFGIAYHRAGKFTEANAAFEQSLHLLEHDPEHESDYAEALNNYAGLNADAGQFEVARAMWLKALHLRQQMGDHAAAIGSLTDLGQLALAQKRIREAKRYIKRASEEMESAHDLADDYFTVFLETQGKLALAEGHASEAVDKFQRALELCQRTRGDEHWLTGWEHILRGKAYAQAGGLNDAARDMAEGLAIIDHALGRKSLNYLAAVVAYSQVLDRAGSHAQAAQLRATAGKTTKDLYGSQCLGCTINIMGFR